ncbi:MAG: ThiF family adenylyltransferase [Vulcanibacillus sp.]
MTNEFSRLELLYGMEAINKLKNSTVVILGIGGVGSFAAEALARSAVGRLILVDKDVIDITNINRQVHALKSTIGEFKAASMKDRIKSINSECDVTSLLTNYNEETTEQIFSYNPDYIVDAIDSMDSKIKIIVESINRNIPIISSMGTANKLDPTQFIVTDISKTYMDPVAKIIRQGLRKHGIDKGVNVVFSPEKPLELIGPYNETGKLGSNGFVPPVAGLIMASIVVRDLTSI